MSSWDPSIGGSDEWYTPAHVFAALEATFDLDVAAPLEGPRHVPASAFICENSLQEQWRGFIWMNPPFGGRNGLVPWLDKFFAHGDGIALTPDRTSAPWWQDASVRCDALLLTRGKIKFERPDGSVGKSPGSGVTLFAVGSRAINALLSAQKNGLGTVWEQSK
jgi:hypothetical protein